MSAVKPLQGSYQIQATGAIETIAPNNLKQTFRKLFIYPGMPQSNNELSVNAGNVKIGKDGNTQKVVTDTIAPGDEPRVYELPANKDESMLLNDIIIKGTQGDGIFFEYWP